MFRRQADYIPDSLPDRKFCNHDSLASEWSYCGPEGHLICRLISSLNRRILYQFLLIIINSSGTIIIAVSVRQALVWVKTWRFCQIYWFSMLLSGDRCMCIQTGCHLRSFSPFMLTSACYSVGRFDTSPGENTWNAIKPVVGLVCASCKPPLVNTPVGCTQVHWLDGEEKRGRYSAKNVHPNKPFSHTFGLEIWFFFNRVRNWANNFTCYHWKLNFVRIVLQKLCSFRGCGFSYIIQKAECHIRIKIFVLSWKCKA